MTRLLMALALLSPVASFADDICETSTNPQTLKKECGLVIIRTSKEKCEKLAGTWFPANKSEGRKAFCAILPQERDGASAGK